MDSRVSVSTLLEEFSAPIKKLSPATPLPPPHCATSSLPRYPFASALPPLVTYRHNSLTACNEACNECPLSRYRLFSHLGKKVEPFPTGTAIVEHFFIVKFNPQFGFEVVHTGNIGNDAKRIFENVTSTDFDFKLVGHILRSRQRVHKVFVFLLIVS